MNSYLSLPLQISFVKNITSKRAHSLSLSQKIQNEKKNNQNPIKNRHLRIANLELFYPMLIATQI